MPGTPTLRRQAAQRQLVPDFAQAVICPVKTDSDLNRFLWIIGRSRFPGPRHRLSMPFRSNGRHQVLSGELRPNLRETQLSVSQLSNALGHRIRVADRAGSIELLKREQ